MLPNNNCGWRRGNETSSAVKRMRKCQHIEVKNEKILIDLEQKFRKADKEALIKLPAEPPFTEKQLAWIKEFNMRLANLEFEIYQDVTKQYQDAKKRVEDETDWTSDFKLRVSLSFWLGEDDPDYYDQDDEEKFPYEEFSSDDNIIIILESVFSPLERNEDNQGFHDYRNYNKYTLKKDHQMYGDYHCWILYSLYEHTDLRWSEIMRIKNIWVDLKMLTSVSIENSGKEWSLD